MNTRITNLILATAAFTFAAATGTDASAQGSWQSKTYTKSVGNSNFGGTMQVAASAAWSRSRYGSNGSASGMVSATGRLFGYAGEIAYARASGGLSYYGGSSANVFVRVAGKTIVNKRGSVSVNVPFMTRTYDLFPGGVTKRIPVYGPIFVTLRGNVGIGLQFGATVGLPSNRIDVSGYGRTWAYARASVSAGVPEVLEAGVEISGNAADQMLSLALSSRPRESKLSGSAVLTVRAISLKLSAFVLAILPYPSCKEIWRAKCWQHKFSYVLTSWSSPMVSMRLLNLL